ncbi:MAG: penicillin-binding protein 2, partial [Rhodobacteraceae bacterium]|nr:penicillin-binding protein 2 [Paracoccaceae bacterium]
MTDTSLRTPLRPLGQILSARAKGEDTREIERENIKRRHDDTKESTLMRAQGRLLLLGIMFLCLYFAIA